MSEKQREIIEQLPVSYLDKCRAAARCPEDEALYIWLKGMVRLDDPVVIGLVEALNKFTDDAEPRYINFFHATKALSAYEARVKEVGK